VEDTSKNTVQVPAKVLLNIICGAITIAVILITAVLWLLQARRTTEAKTYYEASDILFLADIEPATAPLILEDGTVQNFTIRLSADPGFHGQEFYLNISIPDMPNAVIYYTIDGNDPQPGDARHVLRGGNWIKVSGRVPESGEIWVADRSGFWQNAILAHYSDTWRRHRDTLPAEGAEILQGTAFRFRGFVDSVPVTEIITATYIIAPDAAERFNGRPVMMVTAPYEDFIYIYSHANQFDNTTRRRIFHYEFFEHGQNGYQRIFEIPGSTSLGGSGSRMYAQRTFNVHVARGALDGEITHPMIPGVYELYRFRLWNAGNAFIWDHMRDSFAQTASAGLNVPTSGSNLAIKFINGEYWGFTTIREHTSNDIFLNTHTGVDRGNVVIIDSNNTSRQDEHGRVVVFKDVQEGPFDVAMALYEELVEFVTSHDMSTDYARERLFNEFFCQDNFMDYLISQTFFHNTDWPHHNVRFFRVIEPNLDSGNPYNDGRWRFILHDMDCAPQPGAPRYMDSLFPELYALHPWVEASRASRFNYIYLVFNNPTFAKEFVARALYVLDTYFQAELLHELHYEFVSNFRPLLPEMYNRFAIRETVEYSIEGFEFYVEHLNTFLTNRHYYYKQHLAGLLNRLSLEGAEYE